MNNPLLCAERQNLWTGIPFKQIWAAVGENFLDFSDRGGAPIMIVKNNYVAAELNKTKWQTWRDTVLFLVCAVFVKNHCV